MENDYKIIVNQPGQSPQKINRQKNITKIRQSFKLCLEPTKASDIRAYVLSPKYIPGEGLPLEYLIDNSPQKEAIIPFEQKYELLQVLGQGANAVVKKCISKNSKKIYAVKTMQIDQQQALFLRRNFYTVKLLNHPNIVHFKSLHLERKKNKCYLVMDYVTGKKLTDLQNKDQEVIKSIAQQIFLALKFIHEKNICHRDIKPDNIIYNEETNNVKIVDFGISMKTTIRNQRKKMLSMTGTFNYGAPQIFQGGGYDQKIDMWAAGITLFELIQGKTPFESDCRYDTINNIIKGQIDFDQKKWNKYNKFLKDLVARLLRKRHERLSAAQCLQHLWFTKSIQNIEQEDDRYQSTKVNTKMRDIEIHTATSLRKKLNGDTKSKIIKPHIQKYESQQEGQIVDDN